MTHYLCISITFLDSLFHGKADGDEPEWPPSPLRVFQALLAGAHEGCRQREWSDAKAEAFRWLEQREPPEIITPGVRRARGYTLFVPNNDSDKRFARHERLTSKEARPHRMLGGQTIYYLWTIRGDEWPSAQSRIGVLCQEAHHLLALGWGIDAVMGDGRILTPDEALALTGERWHPWAGYRSPGESRRVPVRGTLDDLMRAHEAFLNRVRGNLYHPPRKLRVFDAICYRRVTILPPRPFTAFTLEPSAGQSRRPAFPQVDAAKLAAMLRHVACDAAKSDSHAFPGGSERYVAGHASDRNDRSPRFSYLPLPTVGHQHADGMIRRMLIAEPYGGDGTQVRWAAQRLRNHILVDDRGQEKALLLDIETGDYVVGAYLGEARSWSSITPVILPGFDDGKQEKAERLLLKAVQQAGLPAEAVEEIVLRKAPFWPGSQYPRLYCRPAYLRDLPAWHVRIRLRESISGPLAIGAGRYCGLGLFARHENDRQGTL
jgi:CRISPR-associated protein Csb2